MRMFCRGFISLVFVFGVFSGAFANDIVKYDITLNGEPVHSHGFVVNTVFKNLVEGAVDVNTKLGLQTCYMASAISEKVSDSRHLGYAGFDELDRDVSLIVDYALPRLKAMPGAAFGNFKSEEKPRAEVIEIFGEGSSRQRRLMVAGTRRVIPLCLAEIKSRRGFE